MQTCDFKLMSSILAWIQAAPNSKVTREPLNTVARADNYQWYRPPLIPGGSPWEFFGSDLNNIPDIDVAPAYSREYLAELIRKLSVNLTPYYKETPAENLRLYGREEMDRLAELFEFSRYEKSHVLLYGKQYTAGLGKSYRSVMFCRALCFKLRRQMEDLLAPGYKGDCFIKVNVGGSTGSTGMVNRRLLIHNQVVYSSNAYMFPRFSLLDKPCGVVDGLGGPFSLLVALFSNKVDCSDVEPDLARALSILRARLTYAECRKINANLLQLATPHLLSIFAERKYGLFDFDQHERKHTNDDDFKKSWRDATE